MRRVIIGALAAVAGLAALQPLVAADERSRLAAAKAQSAAAQARADIEGPYERNRQIADHAHALGRLNEQSFERVGVSYDEVVGQHRMLFGGVDECVEHMRWIRDEIGVDYVGASFWFGGVAQDKVLRSMELFWREVVPRLEAIPAAAGRR